MCKIDDVVSCAARAFPSCRHDSGARNVFKRVAGIVRKSLSPPRLQLPKFLKRKAQVVESDSEPETNKQPDPPLAPERREGGRPAHAERGARADAAPAAKLTGLVAPQTPPKRKKKNKPTGGRRLGIKQSAHPPEAGWVSSGACLTVEAYKKFDSWKNDYQPKHYYYGKSIKLIHLGNPCDRQQDIHARPWILAWDTLDRNEPPELANKRVPVFRVVYHCSGHCRHGKDSDDSDDPSAKEGDEQEPDIDSYVDVNSDSPESESGAKSKAKPDLHSLSAQRRLRSEEKATC
ncbi:hypothetical protein C8F04DRAFT_1229336 [Mycena alexandri]|uniref:Uncharacterized protein n=1 Tax=Mycena alexandri TaxID=1745969 RepID=A0AAD6TD37_9AGAR|nr:hypothetical protein C8F04DRAFT_1229336 [Mycena alexandri]